MHRILDFAETTMKSQIDLYDNSNTRYQRTRKSDRNRPYRLLCLLQALISINKI